MGVWSEYRNENNMTSDNLKIIDICGHKWVDVTNETTDKITYSKQQVYENNGEVPKTVANY